MSGADLRRRSALLAGLALPLALPLRLRAQGFDRPPLPGPELPLPRPRLAEARLPNGLRLLVAERRGLPLVSARLLLDLGSLNDPPAKAGLAQLHLQVLSRGAHREGEPQSADEIAFATESLGASLELDSGPRAGSLGLTVARQGLDAALELLADLLLHPLLAADELERCREELLDARQQQLADPAQLAALLARRLHWGHSPAGQLPTPATLGRIQRRDLLEQQRRLRPETSCLVLAGDIDLDEALALARPQFGDWRAISSVPPPPRPALQPLPLEARTVLVNWPGAAQAALALAAPHAGAGESEAQARLALAVLGQGYSSRLNQELRIRRGMSYGVTCEAEVLGGAGLLLASTQTRPTQAAEAAVLMGAELLRLGQEPVGAAELQARRSALLGEYGRQLESSVGLAALLTHLALDGTPLAALQAWPDALLAVQAEALQAFANRHWRADAQRRVIVADLSAAGPSLRQLDPGAWMIPRQRLDPASPRLQLG